MRSINPSKGFLTSFSIFLSVCLVDFLTFKMSFGVFGLLGISLGVFASSLATFSIWQVMVFGGLILSTVALMFIGVWGEPYGLIIGMVAYPVFYYVEEYIVFELRTDLIYLRHLMR